MGFPKDIVLLINRFSWYHRTRKNNVLYFEIYDCYDCCNINYYTLRHKVTNCIINFRTFVVFTTTQTKYYSYWVYGEKIKQFLTSNKHTKQIISKNY